MKVLLVTGAYPPDKCGVGVYASHLAASLANHPGLQVGVLTSTQIQDKEDPYNVPVFRAIPTWQVKDLWNVIRIIWKFRPDVVHIQYPTLRPVGGLPKYLPFLLRVLRLPVVQTWHEHFSGCVTLGWQNLLACDNLVYVRPDFPQKLPAWVRQRVGKRMTFVPNASMIPVASLSEEESRQLKQELSPDGKPIVCFFGFAYPNKGVERLFEIADPRKHRLVLVCDLKEDYPYQAGISKTVNQAPWERNVTVTGFLPADSVGRILAVADAVVFPFPDGAGEWNTSLKAAQAAGVFTLATTQDQTLLGYHSKENIYFAGCDSISEMRSALQQHLGARVAASAGNGWKEIAVAHERVYRALNGM